MISMFGSFPPSPLVGLRLQSLLGPGSRHCYGIITQNPESGANRRRMLAPTVNNSQPPRSRATIISSIAQQVCEMAQQHPNVHDLSIGRRVKVVLEVVEGCKRKNHNDGWKGQTPDDSHGLPPIRRGKKEESSGQQRDNG